MTYPVVPAIPGAISVETVIGDHAVPTQYLAVAADGSYKHTQVIQNADNLIIIAYGPTSANLYSGTQTNTGYRGLLLFVKTGSYTNTPGAVTVVLQAKDPVSNNYFTIWTSPAVTASGFFAWQLYPGVPNSTTLASASQSIGLPATWRAGVLCADWKSGTAVVPIGIAACTMI